MCVQGITGMLSCSEVLNKKSYITSTDLFGISHAGCFLNFLWLRIYRCYQDLDFLIKFAYLFKISNDVHEVCEKSDSSRNSISQNPLLPQSPLSKPAQVYLIYSLNISRFGLFTAHFSWLYIVQFFLELSVVTDKRKLFKKKKKKSVKIFFLVPL